MLVSILNIYIFFQHSIYCWLWLILSLNAALVVLVCSQCSTTRHSACLWRCISHLVFGILPVGSLMFSWQTVCHQVLAAGHLKPRSLGPFYEREWNMLCVWNCVWSCACVCRCMCEETTVRLCASVCACICAGGRFIWVTHRAEVGHWIPSGHQSQKEAFWNSGVFGSLSLPSLTCWTNSLTLCSNYQRPSKWSSVCVRCVFMYVMYVCCVHSCPWGVSSTKDFVTWKPKCICLLILSSSALFTYH